MLNEHLVLGTFIQLTQYFVVMDPARSLKILCSLLILISIPNDEAGAQLALEPFSSGFKKPVSIANAGDSRLFVVEQSGVIRIMDSSGIVYAEPFLDMQSRVRSGGEMGLLGLAFHPDYPETGYFFVNYTAEGPRTIISRYSVSLTDPDRADPESELVLLTIDQPFENHNGGDIRFGPDGMLYIATGDGGSGGDPQNNSQNLATMLGKILRIDVNSGDPYSIPDDNPFINGVNVQKEIWAYGLRNPWRMSFDRETGDLWIADVGQNLYEEINFQPAESPGGENYGWRCYEALHEYNFSECTAAGDYVFPVFEIDQNLTGACSVTGGFVYRGSKYPSMTGTYLLTDYCSGQFWSVRDSTGIWVAREQGSFPGHYISCFGEDQEGELYVAALSSGEIFRLTYAGTTSLGSGVETPAFRLYPNPAERVLNLETITGDQEFQEVHIYDIRGRDLYTESVSGTRFGLALDHLTPGIYFIKVTINGKSELAKFFRE